VEEFLTNIITSDRLRNNFKKYILIRKISPEIISILLSIHNYKCNDYHTIDKAFKFIEYIKEKLPFIRLIGLTYNHIKPIISKSKETKSYGDLFNELEETIKEYIYPYCYLFKLFLEDSKDPRNCTRSANVIDKKECNLKLGYTRSNSMKPALTYYDIVFVTSKKK